jgi:hypothetical protein
MWDDDSLVDIVWYRVPRDTPFFKGPLVYGSRWWQRDVFRPRWDIVGEQFPYDPDPCQEQFPYYRGNAPNEALPVRVCGAPELWARLARRGVDPEIVTTDDGACPDCVFIDFKAEAALVFGSPCPILGAPSGPVINDFMDPPIHLDFDAAPNSEVILLVSAPGGSAAAAGTGCVVVRQVALTATYVTVLQGQADDTGAFSTDLSGDGADWMVCATVRLDPGTLFLGESRQGDASPIQWGGVVWPRPLRAAVVPMAVWTQPFLFPPPTIPDYDGPAGGESPGAIDCAMWEGTPDECTRHLHDLQSNPLYTDWWSMLVIWEATRGCGPVFCRGHRMTATAALALGGSAGQGLSAAAALVVAGDPGLEHGSAFGATAALVVAGDPAFDHPTGGAMLASEAGDQLDTEDGYDYVTEDYVGDQLLAEGGDDLITEDGFGLEGQ